jgi:formiminotetrahydrofolate cyclodeaminase
MEEPTTTSLSDLSARELVARLATHEPIPGGGSAAALAGAMGAALVAMVAELTIGRPDATERDAELRELRDNANSHRERLLQLADDDANAYDAVVRARRLPRESESDKEQRRQAVDAAMVEAAAVPLQTAQVAAVVLDLAARVAPIGNRTAVSDAGVAAQLAATAVRGAILNVRINLPYLPEGAALSAEAPAELARLTAAADEGEEAALSAVERRLEPS